MAKVRLESLDVLRGFDLFCLVVLETILHPLAHALDSETFNRFMWCFTHVEWEGFSSWDLVMPLFLFMTGITIPFSLSSVKRDKTLPRLPIYTRILKRFIILWIFGMICQGNLLGLDSSRIYLYSNTLQTIALGYLVSSILYINLKTTTQVVVSISLLLIYWALMQFASVDGYGAGDYTPTANFAEWVDRVVLGRFRDAATISVDGTILFAPWYNYTWIVSSLNFVVTVMSGMFAGIILKSTNLDAIKKFKQLLFIGVALAVIGYLLGFVHPIIKKLWTSSMTLYSSGWCYILMALFYWLIDVKGYKKHTQLLKVYGMNSITAYMLTIVVSFSSISQSLFHGLEQYVGDYYHFIIALSNCTIIYLILRYMYKHQVFLKV